MSGSGRRHRRRMRNAAHPPRSRRGDRGAPRAPGRAVGRCQSGRLPHADPAGRGGCSDGAGRTRRSRLVCRGAGGIGAVDPSGTGSGTARPPAPDRGALAADARLSRSSRSPGAPPGAGSRRASLRPRRPRRARSGHGRCRDRRDHAAGHDRAGPGRGGSCARKRCHSSRVGRQMALSRAIEVLRTVAPVCQHLAWVASTAPRAIVAGRDVHSPF